MATELTYYLYEGILTGFAAGHFIHVAALSGGVGDNIDEDHGHTPSEPHVGILLYPCRYGLPARYNPAVMSPDPARVADADV